MKLTSEMIRAARALLRWEQADLANEAGVSLATIKRVEKEAGVITGRLDTVNAVETACIKAGIEFTYDRGEGVLRLKGRRKK